MACTEGKISEIQGAWPLGDTIKELSVSRIFKRRFVVRH